MKTNHNNSSFPYSVTDTMSGESGLTKREYFAAMAMQGLSADSGEYNNQTFPQLIAKHAVMIADALIEELNKNSKS